MFQRNLEKFSQYKQKLVRR